MLSSASHLRMYSGVKNQIEASTLEHILPREGELRYD